MAFQGVDVRDWFRPGSGLTLRRLLSLVRGLPHSAPLWRALEAAEEQEKKATPELIRERQAEWKARNDARLAKEAQHG